MLNQLGSLSGCRLARRRPALFPPCLQASLLLRPGGLLLGSTLGAATPREWEAAYQAGYTRWLHSADSLAALLRELGYEQVEVVPTRWQVSSGGRVRQGHGSAQLRCAERVVWQQRREARIICGQGGQAAWSRRMTASVGGRWTRVDVLGKRCSRGHAAAGWGAHGDPRQAFQPVWHRPVEQSAARRAVVNPGAPCLTRVTVAFRRLVR